MTRWLFTKRSSPKAGQHVACNWKFRWRGNRDFNLLALPCGCNLDTIHGENNFVAEPGAFVRTRASKRAMHTTTQSFSPTYTRMVPVVCYRSWALALYNTIAVQELWLFKAGSGSQAYGASGNWTSASRGRSFSKMQRVIDTGARRTLRRTIFPRLSAQSYRAPSRIRRLGGDDKRKSSIASATTPRLD